MKTCYKPRKKDLYQKIEESKSFERSIHGQFQTSSSLTAADDGTGEMTASIYNGNTNSNTKDLFAHNSQNDVSGTGADENEINSIDSLVLEEE